MTKHFFYLLALATTVMFTSCLENNNEPKSTRTLTTVISCRTINGNNVTFSQGNATATIDYTGGIISLTAQYKDADGQSKSLTAPNMQMTAISNTVYEFVYSANQSGSTNNESLSGYIDLATDMLWYTINKGSTQVVCNSQLWYVYTNTTITNPENGNHGAHQQSTYRFDFDSKGETCTMRITNFMPNLNNAIEADKIQYNNLTVTPTVTGYTITAHEVESNYKSLTLTDVNIILNDQCKVINGSFKCNGFDITISGNLFTPPAIN